MELWGNSSAANRLKVTLLHEHSLVLFDPLRDCRHGLRMGFIGPVDTQKGIACIEFRDSFPLANHELESECQEMIRSFRLVLAHNTCQKNDAYWHWCNIMRHINSSLVILSCNFWLFTRHSRLCLLCSTRKSRRCRATWGALPFQCWECLAGKLHRQVSSTSPWIWHFSLASLYWPVWPNVNWSIMSAIPCCNSYRRGGGVAFGLNGWFCVWWFRGGGRVRFHWGENCESGVGKGVSLNFGWSISRISPDKFVIS